MSETVQVLSEDVELLSVLLWQYDNTDNESIEGLIKAKGLWYRTQVAGFWDDWFQNVFNIKTANEFGLSVWAIVLGVSFEVPDCGSRKLNVEQKRLIIRLRFYQLTTRCTVPMINAELADIFGKGNAYVLDTLTMGPMTYVFKEQPSTDVALVLSKYDLLPRPSTVGSRFRVAARTNVFGFGTYNQNFNNGAFYGGDALIDYGWDLTIVYKGDTGYVGGSISAASPDEVLSGHVITITYNDLVNEGEKFSNTVTTKADGSYVDTKTPEKGRWSVVAKTQIDTPICTTLDVQSTTIEFNKIVYEFKITGAFDSGSKAVKGQLTCDPSGVNLAGQNVLITYLPNASNGEGSTLITHTVQTGSDGTYQDTETPEHGRYTCNISCHVVLAAEQVSADVSVPEFVFTNIDYQFGLSIAMDSETNVISGKLTGNQPAPSLANVQVQLFFYPRSGNNIIEYVRTDASGNYKYDSPPVGKQYTVYATVVIDTPFEGKKTVQSSRISFEITYTYALSISYNDSAGSIGGKITASAGGGLGGQTATLTYTNENTNARTVRTVETSSDGTFSDTGIPNGGVFTAVATCSFTPPYGGTVPLQSNEVGYSSVTPGAQVKMIIANVTHVMFCVADGETANLQVDYGDGAGPGKRFRVITAVATEGYSAIIPPEDFKVDGRTQWTVTILNSHTVRFINTTGANRMTFCRLIELIYVASNSRKQCYILAPYSNLSKIHEKAFQSLPNCESFNTAFARLSYLTTIPSDLLAYQTNLNDVYGMFGNSSSLTSFPTGLLNPAANTLQTCAAMFTGCTKLTGDVQDILTVTSKTITEISTLFQNDTLMSGKGQTLLDRLPALNTTNAQSCFKGLTKLEDYDSLPSLLTKGK